MSRGGILAGLDIGSSNVRVLVAEADSGLFPRIIGVGHAPAEGIRRGLLVDLEKTAESVEKAVMEAEKSAGVEVNSVLVSIGGNHLQSLSSYGMTPVSGPGRRVTGEDVEKVGVFVDEECDAIVEIAGQCGLTVAQLHGNEAPSFADRLKPHFRDV